MREQNAGDISDERRRIPRLSVFSFLHATAELTNPNSPGSPIGNECKEHCTGLLSDITSDGVQLAMPAGCEKCLEIKKDVSLHVNTTFIDEMKFDVTGKIIYIEPAQNHHGMSVGIQFTGLKNNQRAQSQIKKICKYGEKLKANDPMLAQKTNSDKD